MLEHDMVVGLLDHLADENIPAVHAHLPRLSDAPRRDTPQP